MCTYPRGVRSNLCSLCVLSRLEQLLVLPHIQVIRTRQVRSARKLERKLRIIERAQDIRDNRVIVNANAKHLTTPVDTNDTVRRLMLGSNKDGVSADPVHVNACTRLEVVKVDEPELGHEIDNSVKLGDLNGDWEIVCRLGREEHVDSFLLERCIWRSVIDFDNVKLLIPILASRTVTQHNQSTLP